MFSKNPSVKEHLSDHARTNVSLERKSVEPLIFSVITSEMSVFFNLTFEDFYTSIFYSVIAELEFYRRLKRRVLILKCFVLISLSR